MKKLKYIKANNIAPRISVGVFVLYWLLLDRLGAPGWVYGVVFSVLGLLQLGNIIRWWTGTAVDLLENGED